MIRFLKEVYLTIFVVIVKVPARPGNTFGKIGSAIAAITLIEWFNFVNILSSAEMLVGKKFLFYYSKPVVLIAFVGLFFTNQYIPFVRKHGIKFEKEFDNLKRPRKILLISSCAVLLLATIIFSVCSTVAHRRFIGADRP